MSRVRALMCERFLDPASGRLFDYVSPETFRVSPEMLPTADEVRAEIPNSAGWGTPIENGPINGGILLGALVDRLDSPAPPDSKLVLAVADGLLELAERASRRGFLPRGLLADRKTHYPNSSVDQYTKWLYGMWRFSRCPLADEDRKQRIRRAVAAMCARIEQDGFDILRSDGKPAKASDIGVIRMDRSCRLLLLYKLGGVLDGDARWAGIYRNKISESDGARLKDITDPPPVEKANFYVWIQNQVSLRVLHETEDDARLKETYRLGLRAINDRAERVLDRHKGYDPAVLRKPYGYDWRGQKGRLPDPWIMQRRCIHDPLGALFCVGISDDEQAKQRLAPLCSELLRKFDYELLTSVEPFVYAEAAFAAFARGGHFGQ
ncbi:MAG: hypothetical protein FJ388_21105 [Verrucomicrobia bacterium]|nr:hypothetical protein [Verrucomicrobiota bacterium]